MCTVTIIPLTHDAGRAGGRDGQRAALRIVANRDELRTRPAALPPQIRTFGRHRAVMPIDPVSDGTWIAASDAGFALTLLNVTRSPGTLRGTGFGSRAMPARSTSLRSRGAIIPSLLHLGSAADALRAACQLDAPAWPPFRLLLIDPREVWECRSDGVSIVARVEPADRALLFTSSGLGDELVEPPRRALFEQMFGAAGADLSAVQDRFARHTWPDRLYLSVCMRRAEARTVSRTTLLLDEHSWALQYGEVDADGSDGTVSNTFRLDVRA